MTCMGAEGLQRALKTATDPLLQRFGGSLCIPPPQYHLLTFHETSELEFAQGHTFTFRGAQATFMGYMHANSENPT